MAPGWLVENCCLGSCFPMPASFPLSINPCPALTKNHQLLSPSYCFYPPYVIPSSCTRSLLSPVLPSWLNCPSSIRCNSYPCLSPMGSSVVDCFNCVNDAYVPGEVARAVRVADGISVPGDNTSIVDMYGCAPAALFA
jgi:hypothetical protein